MRPPPGPGIALGTTFPSRGVGFFPGPLMRASAQMHRMAPLPRNFPHGRRVHHREALLRFPPVPHGNSRERNMRSSPLPVSTPRHCCPSSLSREILTAPNGRGILIAEIHG
jgi:hypothetical protein